MLYFPLPKNEFPVIFFVGGFDGVVLAEFYEIALRKIASHGFYVFGVDYKFPVLTDASQQPDLKPFYDELNFIQQYMPNKTLGTPLWNKMSLLCHSSGCDITLRMIRDNSTRYKSTVFLEPFSFDVQTPVTNTIPAMMYGTEYCEEGLVTCCVKGKDYARFYDIWKCPRIKVEVAETGKSERKNRPLMDNPNSLGSRTECRIHDRRAKSEMITAAVRVSRRHGKMQKRY
ncbi:hypothetical protein CHS0354_027167 [Potamilus streckersoni]|uniref:Uncharacterized protein n=1 Tax=Potamilus streckersoni TaxID=2493646 RepID=A0AAE0TJE2_9BIVA|nr:hypothetical protein CHS0354_027167 [Potamilus streckersoni]